MSKSINFSLEEEYVVKMDRIAKAQYSDRTKLLRKWIDQNYKKVFEE